MGAFNLKILKVRSWAFSVFEGKFNGLSDSNFVPSLFQPITKREYLFPRDLTILMSLGSTKTEFVLTIAILTNYLSPPQQSNRKSLISDGQNQPLPTIANPRLINPYSTSSYS
jgi:hypothetical protein